MRSLLFSLVVLAWAMPALAHPPAAGDVFVWQVLECHRLLHVDPTTGANHEVSKWGDTCVGGAVVGTGLTDWDPDSTTMQIHADGWFYLLGRAGNLPSSVQSVYRISPTTGDRELVTVVPEMPAPALVIWPESNFFPPTVAALSIGAGVLLVGTLVGVATRGAKHRSS